MTIVGTRPELIKLSEIIKQLDKHTDHVFVHTGQNYDYELNEIFYKDLGLREPDYYLDAVGDSLGETIGNILEETERLLRAEKPDAVVILGDTNSALAGIIVKRLKIPLFHLEAGNRCFDDNVPEEINRRILDHISDINMVYTQGQRLYLRDEGIAKDRIFVMGSPMKEVIGQHIDKIAKRSVLEYLGLIYPETASVPYYLVSIHRDENIEVKQNFEELVKTLNALCIERHTTVILSAHPRLQKKLDAEKIKLHSGIRVLKPFGFLDYCKLQMGAECVISDSGTLAEESAILGFKAITIRNAHERAEATDAGSILMSGVDKDNILTCLDVVQVPTTIPIDYTVENCSERVLKVILGYTGYVNRVVWRKGTP